MAEQDPSYDVTRGEAKSQLQSTTPPTTKVNYSSRGNSNTALIQFFLSYEYLLTDMASKQHTHTRPRNADTKSRRTRARAFTRRSGVRQAGAKRPGNARLIELGLTAIHLKYFSQRRDQSV